MDVDFCAFDSCMLGLSIEFYTEVEAENGSRFLSFHTTTDELAIDHMRMMVFKSEREPIKFEWTPQDNCEIPPRGVFVIYANIIGSAANLNYGLVAKSYDFANVEKTGQDRRDVMQFFNETQGKRKRTRWDDEGVAGSDLAVKHVRTDDGKVDKIVADEGRPKISIGFVSDILDFDISIYKKSVEIEKITLLLKIHEIALADKLEELARALLADLGRPVVAIE